MSDSGQKTEQPTHRRMDEARREGRFPASREFIAALQFCVFITILFSYSQQLLDGGRKLTRLLLLRAFTPELTVGEVARLAIADVGPAILPLFLMGALITLTGLAAQLGTTQMGFSVKKLTPNFAQLNPGGRLKDLPRQNLGTLVQSLILLPLFLFWIYAVVRDNAAAFRALPLMGLEAALAFIGTSFESYLWKAAGVLLIFGCIDLFRQKRRHTAQLRMSKQEIREEYKESEGDPQLKARIRRIQRDLLRKQMMKEVPKATAVIVNPTHFAVAIRYQLETSGAPVVVAKGKNYLALRIKQKAIEHSVPIIENPPLAQALYKSAEVGQEIPAHLYRAVAEILAYIYRIMNGRLPGS